MNAVRLFAGLSLALAMALTGCGGGGDNNNEPQCTGGQLACNGVCVSTLTDSQNCGACGVACGTGTACMAGACIATCGDGVKAGTEACDDGDKVPDDGCSSACTIETGWSCQGSPSQCTTGCGDGTRAGMETCDDKNGQGGDGCSAACAVETGFTCTGAPSQCVTTCGDGVTAGTETCDDGNTTAADGCSETCAAETGYVCNGSPSTCATVCGDGVIAGTEVCDDQNTTDGDGCSAACDVLEGGFTCTGTPSVCVTTCGDQIVAGAETCDDGNTNGGDCCSATCTLEPACEIEPNDNDPTANAWANVSVSGLVKGFVSPAETDLDVYSITLSSVENTLIAATQDGPLGSTCAGNEIDTFITIRDASGAVLVSNDDSSTDYCSYAAVNALANGQYFVEVKKSPLAGATGVNDYSLSLTATVTTCGNGAVEAGESCDDSNIIVGDGCDASCHWETTAEVEPNNASSSATPLQLARLGLGAVSPIADVDYWSFTLTAASDVEIETFDANGPSTCSGVDTVIRLYAPDGTTLLATDDESGVMSCSKIDPVGQPGAAHLLPGTYYVYVEDYQNDTEILGYTVRIKQTAVCGNMVVEGAEECDGTGNCDANCDRIPVCGDGLVDAPEQCDDANTNVGDGCSATCMIELPFTPTYEVEPNNAHTAATVLPSGNIGVGAISTGPDVDYWSFTLSATANVTIETFDQYGPSTCANIDTVIRLYATDGTTMLATDDEDGVNSCSKLSFATETSLQNLAAGTYYVYVEDYLNDSVIPGYTLRITAQSCGNGVVEGTEECDGGASCTATCERVPVCGDGFVDAPEQCDDSNTTAGDGCSATCIVEPPFTPLAEVEPNNSSIDADARGLDATPIKAMGSTLFSGAISTVGDKDYFRVEVATATAVRFETFGAGYNDCPTGLTTTVKVFDSTGVTALYTDNTSGISSCSAVVAYLQPGTYYAQVEETGNNVTISGYLLEVRFETSGGNEAEPNETSAAANPISGTEVFVFGGHQLGTDSDYFAITVPAGKSLRAEIVEGGTETCESNDVDSRITLYSSTGLELADDDDDGRGFCSKVDGTGLTSQADSGASNLAAGTYYLQVRASQYADPTQAVFDYRLVVTIR